MRSYLKLKPILLNFNRLKSKSSNPTADKAVLKKLDEESYLLFGDTVKPKKKKIKASSITKKCTNKQFIDHDISKISDTKTPIPIYLNAEPHEAVFPLFNELKDSYDEKKNYNFSSLQENQKSSFSSISNILSETKSELSQIILERWKKKQIAELGNAEFLKQQQGYLTARSEMMQIINKQFLGTLNENLDIPESLKGCWKSMKPTFKLFSKALIIDVMISHPDLKYKGGMDGIVEFKKKPCLVSWKKSKILKPHLSSTYDMPLQLVATLGALHYDVKFPFSVHDILLIMSYEDGTKADIFHLNEKICLQYWSTWLERLLAYKQKIEINSLKIKYGDENETVVNEVVGKKDELDKKIDFTPTHSVDSQSQIKKEFLVNFPIYNRSKKKFKSGYSYKIAAVWEKSQKSYPSVTRILNDTRSESAKFALLRWKQNLINEIGEEGFNQYQKNILLTGTKLHSLIQKRLTGCEECEIPTDLEGCWKSLELVFPLFSGFRITETNVVHNELKYKGIIDCIAEFKGKPVLIDWKKSEKLKETIDMTYDAPLQIAAYIGAANYDDQYPFKVEEGLVVMSYTDGTKADIFHLNKKVIKRYWSLWLERLRGFYDQDTKISCE